MPRRTARRNLTWVGPTSTIPGLLASKTTGEGPKGSLCITATRQRRRRRPSSTQACMRPVGFSPRCLTFVLQPPEDCCIGISAKVNKRMMNALLEYYRCPAEFSCLELLGKPSPGPGFFRFGGTTLFGRPSVGMPAEAVESRLDEIANYSEVRDSKCYLPFDADEVVTNLREERYTAKRHGSHVGSAGRGLARRAYYFVRPILG